MVSDAVARAATLPRISFLIKMVMMEVVQEGEAEAEAAALADLIKPMEVTVTTVAGAVAAAQTNQVVKADLVAVEAPGMATTAVMAGLEVAEVPGIAPVMVVFLQAMRVKIMAVAVPVLAEPFSIRTARCVSITAR